MRFPHAIKGEMPVSPRSNGLMNISSGRADQSNRNASANSASDTMPPAMIATSKIICPARPPIKASLAVCPETRHVIANSAAMPRFVKVDLGVARPVGRR